MPSAKHTDKPEAVSAASESPSRSPSRLQMADIARLAGVSVSTVSRALAHSPLVNEGTRQRVAELAKSLHYSINVGAQNLRLKQNRTIAVNVPYDPATGQHLSDSFFLSLIGSLADALTARGYDMLLSRVDADRLDLAAQTYETGRAAGLVLVGQWRHHDQLNTMAVRGVPFVVWGGQLAGQIYATVGSDNLQGGRLATAHMLDQGARQVAFFGDPELPEIGLRHQGYLRALKEARLKPAPRLVRRVPFVSQAIEREVERLCAEGTRFDAVFAASDLMAMTVINTLRRLGRGVPSEVLVAGYDDIELARHFHPALTTVRQPIAEAGLVLVEQVLAQVGGARAQSHLLPTTLEVRESSRRG
jgi:DNA-binding LacI/PurR family transcriptional regulator